MSNSTQLIINKKYFKKTYVDLPELFKELRSINRGMQHKEVNYLEKRFAGNWHVTVINNSMESIKQFHNMCKHLGILTTMEKPNATLRKIKFYNNRLHMRDEKLATIFEELDIEAQMFSGISGTTTSATQAFAKMTSVLEKVDGAIDSYGPTMKTLLNNVTAISNSISEKMAYLGTNEYLSPLIHYMLKMISLAYLLTNKENRRPSSLLALITLIIPTGIGNSLITSLSRAIQGVMGLFYKDQDEEIKKNVMSDDHVFVFNDNYCEFEAQAGEENLIVSFFMITKQVIMGMFKSVDVCCLKDMQLSAAKIKVVADYIRSSNTIIDLFCKVMEKCIQFMGDCMLKNFGVVPWFLKEDRISPLVDEYVEMKTLKRDVKAKTNSIAAKQVVKLYHDVLKVQADMVKVVGKQVSYERSRVMPYLSVMVKSLEQIVAQIPEHLRGTKNARRIKPFWVYIYGDPRIGKTAMFQPYLINKIARECEILDKYEDYSNYTYFRNCGDEYWEKYAGQPFLWYNDLFQTFTNEQNVNEAIMELTNVVDDNLYPLNMAFDEKHSVYFGSEFVISNAQRDIQGMSFISEKCLSGGEHLYARRNLVVRFRLNPEYKSTYGPGINFKMSNEMAKIKPSIGDPNDPLFPKDLYILDFMDVNHGDYCFSKSFEEGINYIIACAKHHRSTQNVFKDKLYKHFETMWAQGDESTYDDALDYSLIKCDACRNFLQRDMMSILEDQQIAEMYNIMVKHDLCFMQAGTGVYTDAVVLEPANCWKSFSMKLKRAAQDMYSDVKNQVNANPIIKIVGAFTITWLVTFSLSLGMSYLMQKTGILNGQSNEGNLKTQSRQVKRVKNVVIAQSYDQQNNDVEMKIRKNMVQIGLCVKHLQSDVRMGNLGSCLGIGGDVFVVPKHFWSRLKEMSEFYATKGDIACFTITLVNEQEFIIPFKDIVALDLDYTHTADIIYLRFPYIVQFASLNRYFVSALDDPNFFQPYLYGIRLKGNLQSMSLRNMTTSAIKYNLGSREDPIYGMEFKKRPIEVPLCYMYYGSMTLPGDCGMVLMNTDSKMNARKCMGLHTAGEPNSMLGISGIVYAEDIEEALATLSKDALVTLDAQDGLWPEDKITSIIYDDVKKFFFIDGCIGDKEINGKIRKIKMTIPSKSKISKSVVYNIMEQDFGPALTCPAALSPRVVDGIRISPLVEGLRKMSVVTKYIGLEYMNPIKKHLLLTLKSWGGNYVLNPRILTDSEMINGFDILKSIDMTTSAGYPYTLYQSNMGKKPWFSGIPQQYEMQGLLKDQFNVRLEKARKGIIHETYFVDTLKDETRPIDKVKSLKTRVFQVGPMCLSLLMRKYFGWFIMHCQSTYINGEMAIGINPNSNQWTFLIRRLLTCGDKFINGDYSNYDASVSQQVMMHIVEVINQFYGGTDEDNLIRKVIFATFLNNKHIVEDFVFTRYQGNMSGIALTTIVNCLFNMVLIRYSYMLVVSKSLQDFHVHLSCSFYGDDNLIAVHADIQDKLTMKIYNEHMADLNITYTTADKKGVPQDLIELKHISFLKRKFVKDPIYDLYLAPLDLNVIHEIPRWSESDPYNTSDQLNRFNSALLEISNYGEKQYDYMFGKYSEYLEILDLNGMSVNILDLLTYDYIKKLMFPEIYSIQCLDLFQLSEDKLKLLNIGGSLKSKQISSNSSANCGYPEVLNSTSIITDIINMLAESHEGHTKQTSKQIKRTKQNKIVAQCNDVPVYYPYYKEKDNIVDSINFKEEFKLLSLPQAQSSEVAQVSKMDENAGATVTRNQITTTFDDTIPHLTTRGGIPEPIVCNPFIDVTLPSFTEREWYIGERLWRSTDPRDILGPGPTLPKLILKALKAKLENIALWAPDFELIFKVNGTPMHYGRLMALAVPQADYLSDAYKLPLNANQHRFVQISPTGNQTVVMKLPWMHHRDRVPIGQFNANVWSIYFWVAVPLSSATSATPSSVTVSIYCKITNPRFVGYTHEPLPDIVAQSSEQNVLSIRNNVADVPKSTGIFSVAEKVAKDVTAIAADMSQLAVAVGFATPANLSATQPMIVRGPLLAKMEDLPTTNVLGPTMAASLHHDDSMANASENEMLLTKMCGRMCLESTKKITKDTVVGTELWAMPLTPANLFTEDYALSAAAGCIFPLPAAYFGRMAQLWRGSFRFHFSFVASAFHSMRVRFSYRPKTVITATTPDALNSGFDVNEVWDINNQTDYSLTIPFSHWSTWCTNGDVSGYCSLTALTTLASNSDTPNPIYLQVWASMCDDFQLAYPRILSVGTLNGLYGKFYNPDFITWKPTTARIEAQSNNKLAEGNPMLNYRTQQFPAMSSDGLQGLNYPTIGGKGDGFRAYKVATACEISSVKQFVNMLSPLERTSVKSTAPATLDLTYINYGRKLAPYVWIDRDANDSCWGCYWVQAGVAFRYARGGVRMVALSDRALSATAYMTGLSNSWAGSFWTNETADVFFAGGDLSYLTDGGHLFRNLATEPADITIPYYSDCKCLPQAYGPAGVISFAPSCSSGGMLLRFEIPTSTAPNTEVGKIVWFLAGGDDYSMGYQLPIPRCRHTAP